MAPHVTQGGKMKEQVDQRSPADVKAPPESVGAILKQLGPGLIIAGSIVGSGELIATTAVGAEAGFALLWLIIIGCLIKVFVQIEFGRYAIVNGRTTMEGLNAVPGPRMRVNWLCWFWLVFIVVALAQLGGIVGGVGQALSIYAPITADGEVVNEHQNATIRLQVIDSMITRFEADPAMSERVAELQAERATLQASQAKVNAAANGTADQAADQAADRAADQAADRAAPTSDDPLIWGAIITAGSIVLLLVGRYRFIQNLSTLLVASFTLITIGNLIHLQSLPEWRVNWSDLAAGMSFRIPPGEGVTVALAAFGIIGVGATELIQYPYWCLEKGYARWAGPRDGSDEWAKRAAGWVRVLKWDAWCSMVVYTFATVAFYLLGAAILGRGGLDPSGDQMVRTLSEMYVPVFGEAAQSVFLLGAFAVLYSTYFVATASHARVCADALRVFGVTKGESGNNDKAYYFWVRVFCVVFPLLFLFCFAFFKAPKQLVLAGGFMGALMLPLLGVAALYFRYRRCDEKLRPGKAWDIGLWVSCIGMLLAGAYALYDKVIAKLIAGG